MVGASQSAIATNNADEVPHEAPNLIPILGDHHGLMAGADLAMTPFRDPSYGCLVVHPSDCFFRSRVGEDEGLQEGVRSESVGTVQAGGGDFARGEEVREVGLALQVGAYTSAAVVRGGNNRNRLSGHVYPKLQTMRIDVWKTATYKITVLVGDVESDIVFARSFQLIVDCSGDDIPRSQVAHLVGLAHKGLSLPISKDSPFSPHRLADQERLGVGVEKASWVELHELHVCDGGSGSIRHGYTIP